ncbi:MAG: alkaline phosphatase family protein [Bacteriovoracaceae bacterium]|nr:alkaline phosphatase family protein [Bacteriovoracaceae bacterium]
MRCLFLFLLLFSFPLGATNHERLMSLKTVTRFVYGSCNDQTEAQPLWNEMLKARPDFFMWAGDNVYADREHNKSLKLAIQKQNKIPAYLEFKKEVPIMGMWDDHDFGGNNTNGYFEHKVQNQKHFLDFLEEPENSQRRKQEGVYTSYTFGKIKFLLLDNRYFLDLDPGAAMLGEKQWQWLEKELTDSQASIHFIMSGLSILSPVHALSDGSWANYPEERDRLLLLVEKLKTKGVVFLTGDMHFSSIFRRRGHLEFLSSGMTHRVPRIFWGYLGSRYETSFFGLNFGVVDIDWDEDQPILSMAIRNRRGEEFHRRTFRLQDNRWIEDKMSESGFVAENFGGNFLDGVD